MQTLIDIPSAHFPEQTALLTPEPENRKLTYQALRDEVFFVVGFGV